MVPAKNFQEDQINLEVTPELSVHLGKEVFLFSCKIVKYNRYGWRNTRTFCITQESFYLLKDKCRKLRRKVAITSLCGLTMSYHHESSEMIIHVVREEDIRIASPGYRKNIMDTIKMFYATKTRDNIAIFGVRQKSLASYQT